MNLEGRVAFVTGASGGIGAAVARSLVGAGVKVGLASRRGTDLDLGDMAYGLACDVSDHEEVDASVAATVERFGQLDILVANTGGPPAGALASFGAADWSRATALLLEIGRASCRERV